MRRILFVAFLLLCSTINIAQTTKSKRNTIGAISGVIVDVNTKEALPYVNVVIRDANNQILTGGITDDKGKFNIKKIAEGKNTVEIQYIGYKKYSKEFAFTSKSASHRLGTVHLEEDAEVLNEVVVRAELSTVTQKN